MMNIVCKELFLIHKSQRKGFLDHFYAKDWMKMHEAHPLSLLSEDLKHPSVVEIVGEGYGSLIPVVPDPFDDDVTHRIIDVDKEMIKVVNEFHAYCIACRYHIYNCWDPSDSSTSFIDHVNSMKHIGCLLLKPDLSGELFTVHYPSRGIWLCKACNQQVTKKEKPMTQTLRECLEEHIRNPTHQNSLQLFNSKKFLMLLATTKQLSQVLQFSRYSNTAYCRLCDEEFPKFAGFSHLEGNHLNRLEKLFESFTTLDEKLWQKVLNVSSSYCSEKGRFFSINSKPKPEDNNVDKIMKLILSKSWADFQPHPSTMIEQIPTKLAEKFEKADIYVINTSHALCRLCRYHIVTKMSENDLGSVFVKHINSQKHLKFEENFSKEGDMFTVTPPYCNACRINIEPKAVLKKPHKLSRAIERHLIFPGHQKNKQIFDSFRMALLAGLSFTLFNDMFDENLCTICDRSFEKFHYFTHCRSNKHLLNVASYIKNKTGFDLDETITEDLLLSIVESLVQL